VTVNCDLIRSSDYQLAVNPIISTTTMTVTPEELEAAIRAAIQVTHVEVEDNSGGCGEKYIVLIVSKVL
jgi:stress-induced morphogen